MTLPLNAAAEATPTAEAMTTNAEPATTKKDAVDTLETTTTTTTTSTTNFHNSVVLFYQYFISAEHPLLHRFPRYYENELARFSKTLCQRLGLKGRVLISAEGVNGTVSAASPTLLRQYIRTMEALDLLRDCGTPPNVVELTEEEKTKGLSLFAHVDWKESWNDTGVVLEPFPDLKISIVKEIISTGGSVSVDEIPDYGGRHLSPREFHQTLVDHADDVVLVDVRNTFEYDVGHFIVPPSSSQSQQPPQPALNPETVTFSSFDDVFGAKYAAQLQNKKVLMYCTGGIRCEKASVMLKRRGVADVSQLSGGIHRYLEEFGDAGFFKGINFVFDQRVTMTPAECQRTKLRAPEHNKKENTDNVMNDSNDDKNISSATSIAQPAQSSAHEVVGRCVECETPYDEISGARICTVCRDLVLICPSCANERREYHCRRHQGWKDLYYTFLEVFDETELAAQRQRLALLRDATRGQKNVRRTLGRQLDKVDQHLADLRAGRTQVNRSALRRCRTCMETSEICDGLCWGFWKTQIGALRRVSSFPSSIQQEPMLPIRVGDFVEPGPHWNVLRFGPKTEAGQPRRGRVVEVKSWGAGATENDCVVVVWDDGGKSTSSSSKRANVDTTTNLCIYRWGTVALNGKRQYDLQRLDATASVAWSAPISSSTSFSDPLQPATQR